MLTLYYHPRTCSLGVQIALLEAGIAHELVETERTIARSEFLKINSLGTVPALATDAGVLTETSAIMCWLALNYPTAKLLPQDTFGFANGVSLLSWLSSSAHIARRQMRFPTRFTTSNTGLTEIKESGSREFTKFLERMDAILAKNKYLLAGDQPSACDYQLMVYANWCAIDELSTRDFENFERWKNSMVQRPMTHKALKIVQSPLIH